MTAISRDRLTNAIPHRPTETESPRMIFQLTAGTKQSCNGASRVMARLGMVLGVVALVGASGARAQDLEPRAYVDTPVGMNFLIASYAYSEGGVSTDPSLPIEGAELQLNNFVLAYSRALNVFGKSGKIDLILPFSQLSGSALLAGQPVERDVTGFGDPLLRFSVNFYGAPALSMKEYRSYKQNVIIGTSFQVTATFSQYDTSKAVNIGTNRWS